MKIKKLYALLTALLAVSSSLHAIDLRIFTPIGFLGGGLVGSAAYAAKAKIKQEKFSWRQLLGFCAAGSAAGTFAGIMPWAISKATAKSDSNQQSQTPENQDQNPHATRNPINEALKEKSSTPAAENQPSNNAPTVTTQNVAAPVTTTPPNQNNSAATPSANNAPANQPLPKLDESKLTSENLRTALYGADTQTVKAILTQKPELVNGYIADQWGYFKHPLVIASYGTSNWELANFMIDTGAVDLNLSIDKGSQRKLYKIADMVVRDNPEANAFADRIKALTASATV